MIQVVVFRVLNRMLLVTTPFGPGMYMRNCRDTSGIVRIVSTQAGQLWALTSMPFRGEVIEVLEPLVVRCKTSRGRDALNAAISKLVEDKRYMVPTFVTFVSRQLKVCSLHDTQQCNRSRAM